MVREAFEVGKAYEAIGIHLTENEAKIIRMLEARTAVRRDALMEELWGYLADEMEQPANQINVHISNLRRKGFKINGRSWSGYVLLAIPQGCDESEGN